MPHYNLPHNHGQNIERVLDNMPSAEGFQDISFLRGMCMQHSGGC